MTNEGVRASGRFNDVSVIMASVCAKIYEDNSMSIHRVRRYNMNDDYRSTNLL